MIQQEHDVLIANYTYYKIGGVARDVYFPRETSELLELTQELDARSTEYYVLGGGTNVLVGDGYWDGAVVITTSMDSIEAKYNNVVCGAGLPSTRVADAALEHEKTGLEFLYLLPGTIGGAHACV